MLKLITCLIALSFAAFAGAAAEPGKIADISHDELLAVVKAKSAVIIDVNGTDSYRQGHIPGAIDFQTEKDALASKLPADKGALVVAYCGSPKCTAYKQAAEAAIAMGYTNVKHYSGGIAGWKEKGAPIEVAALPGAAAPAKPN